MLRYLIGGAVIAFVVLLIYGGLTGRMRMRKGCCCPTDPDKDLRMRTSKENASD